MTDVLQVHPCKENGKKLLRKRTDSTGKVPQDKSFYNVGQNRQKICTPVPPQIKDGKMARLGFRRASSLIWEGGGGGGGLLFHFILSKIVVRIIMNKNYYGFNKAKAY